VDGSPPADTAAAARSAASAPPPAEVLRSLGTPAEDRARLASLRGEPGAAFSLIRSPSAQAAALPGEGGRAALVPVEARIAYNAALPHSLNEGPLWAGRGWSVAAQAGARLEYGGLSLVLAPVITYTANQPFSHLPMRDTAWSAFVAPWRRDRFSVDLPVRFGLEPLARIDPGQSTLALQSGSVAVGISTEAQWWGPGIRNAIVMSNNAPGIPHAFLRTRSPARTPLGAVEARWMTGVLTESPFFDGDRENDRRTINAAVATLRPRGEPNLTVGLARAVMAGGASAEEVVRRAPFGFLRLPGPDTVTAAPADTAAARAPGAWQVTALFGRWVFPRDGLEVYGEWARHELPRSVRSLLVAPHHTQGYTAGLQWAGPLPGSGTLLRLQAEVTNLEQAATHRFARRSAFYASPSIPQGYTQRGQAVGASIGPGASAQWLAVDLVGRGAAAGVYGNRIRWENDSYYESPFGIAPYAHDVSVIYGLRGHARGRFGTLGVDVGREQRLNYQYQNPRPFFGPQEAEDFSGLTLRVFLSTAG
jgi:hypothetical protein